MADSAVHTRTGAGAFDFPAGASVGDFIALLKPRVMSLVVFTGVAGLVAAPGAIHPVLAAIAVLCIAVAAGAAGAINMWYDRDIDALMTRTRERPIPAGRMVPAEALAFGVVLSIASVLVMALAVNFAAAALLALSILFYVFVYTVWLKRRTPQNIVIGGAAGAFPPMIGWAAVTGDVSLGLAGDVRDHLHLDAAAFLGAVAVPRGRLRARRRADAAGRRRRARDEAPDHSLFARAAAGVAGALCARRRGRGLCGGRRRSRPDPYRRVVRRLARCGETAAKRLFGFSILYLFLLFALMMFDSARAGLS